MLLTSTVEDLEDKSDSEYMQFVSIFEIKKPFAVFFAIFIYFITMSSSGNLKKDGWKNIESKCIPNYCIGSKGSKDSNIWYSH